MIWRKMIKERQMQAIAMFMAVLIVCLPIYVSDAYAATLSIRKASGADDVEGFMRRSDTITIEAAASISEEEDVLSDNLRIYVNNGTAYRFFDSCERAGETASFLCIMNREVHGWSGINTFDIGLFTAQTKYDEFADPAASAVKTISVDIGPSGMDYIKLEPNRSKEQVVEVMYSATDYGIAADNMDGCSGIDRIDFYRDSYVGELIKTEIPPEYTCVFEGSFTYTAPEESGEVVICAKAFDRLEQSSTESVCQTFFIDQTGPVPKLDSIRVTDPATGVDIEYIGGVDPILADISVTIPDEDIVVGKTRADISELAGPTFSSVPPSSHAVVPEGNLFVWKNVPLKDASSCTVTINAEDIIGNTASTPVPCAVKIDTEGPAINALKTPGREGEIYVIGVSTLATAGITEKAVGLYNEDIYLDLTNINGRSRVRPDNCTQIKDDSWECYWRVEPSVPDGDYSVVIYKESKDDLNNILDKKFETTLRVDRTSPALEGDVELTVLPSAVTLPYPDITIAGDNLEFVVAVSDQYSAAADFSAMGGGTDVLPYACETINETIYCTWKTAVEASGPYDADITFSFMDAAGNVNNVTRSIFVSGIDDEPSPDHWGHTIICSPYCEDDENACIDKELASFLGMPAFCNIRLAQKIADPAKTVMSFNMQDYPTDCHLISVDGTENSTYALTDLVSDIIMMNINPGTLNPYMSITMQSGDFEIDYFDFVCSYSVFTRIGEDKYTLNPETENVSVVVEFYGDPFGTPDEGLDDKIDSVKSSISWIDEWFTSLMNVVEGARKMCTAYAALNNAGMAFVVLTGIFHGFVTFTEVNPGAAPSKPKFAERWLEACRGDAEFKKGIFGLGKIFDPMCAILNCKWSEDILKDLKGQWEDAAEYGGARGYTGEAGWISAYIKNTTFDVKDSVIWSLVTGCVPGLLYKLNEWKEIQCQYGICLVSYVPAGFPISVCQMFKGQAECKLIFGELFNLIPQLNAFLNAMDILMGYFADPLATIGWILAKVLGCNAMCNPATSYEPGSRNTEWLCAVLGITSMIGKAVADYEQLKDPSYWATGNSTCDQWYEALDDYEEAE